MAPTLHHVPRTISSPIVQTLLELELVPGTIDINVLSFADLKSEAHLAINPMGTSPAFQDGDIILWESGAVLNYILEEYDSNCKFYPAPRTEKRAKYLHLQQYIIATVYPFIASLFIHTLKDKSEHDVAYIANAKAKWRDLLAPTLTEWLGDGPYFLGDQMSVVDFLVCKPLNNVDSLGMLDGTLKTLFDRISSRPSFAAAYGITPLDLACKVEYAPAEQPSSRSLNLVPSN